MPRSYSPRWSAGLLLVLGCCALDAGCRIVLNFPGAGEGGQPGNCTAYAARRQAPAGPGGPGSDSSAPDGEPLRQCSATAQEQAAGPAVAGEPGPAVPAGPIPRE